MKIHERLNDVKDNAPLLWQRLNLLYAHTIDSLNPDHEHYRGDEFYEQVTQYGLSSWRHTVFFRDSGSIDIVAENWRMAEITPDNRFYLHIPQGKYWSNSYVYRWKEMFHDLRFNTTAVEYADGRTARRVYMYGRTAATAKKRIEIVFSPEHTPKLVAADPEGVNAKPKKNRAKYREFNKQLKTLRHVLQVQARMDKENWLRQSFTWRMYNEPADDGKKALQTALANAAQDPTENYYSLRRSSALKKAVYNRGIHWLQTHDPQALKDLCVLACAQFPLYRESYHDTYEVAVSRARTVYTLIQTEYLRSECIIMEGQPTVVDLFHDKNDRESELLPPSGLREVQAAS